MFMLRINALWPKPFESIVMMKLIYMLHLQLMSEDALCRIEEADPPLFLRFVNLLVNDAHFLLDEALDVSCFFFILPTCYLKRVLDRVYISS